MQRGLIHPVNKVIRKIFRPFGSLTRSEHRLKKELRLEDGTLFRLTTPSFGFQLGNKSTLSLRSPRITLRVDKIALFFSSSSFLFFFVFDRLYDEVDSRNKWRKYRR